MSEEPDKLKILTSLRSSEKIIPHMYEQGYVKASFFGDNMESVVDGHSIDSVIINNEMYIRATYGHSGKVLERLNHGFYEKYDGTYNIFCITHTSPFGLGAINKGRQFNILNIPERCENKGIKLYINIDDARKDGLEFWSPVNDTYKNKIFCFDSALRYSFFKIEYLSTYSNPEKLLISHAKLVETMKNMIGKNMSEAEKNDNVLKNISKLIISDSETESDS